MTDQGVFNNAFIASLAAQRNAALNAVAEYEAQIAVLKSRLEATQKELEDLKNGTVAD